MLPESLCQSLLPKGCIAVVQHCQGGILTVLVAMCTGNLVFLLFCGTQQQILLGGTVLNESHYVEMYIRVFFGPLYV